ncbi:hypothetical protein VP1G_04455 [Cytospora mali]|uniref:Zn(2)-C6 fungal-type domain-containing protein n=1 Tax=Cytospora mali TaxID=578113 RepID=A0A194UZH4_CYTMA|nr:hypothetical protein VP1G_04455 [Valsa mali var. pyri (nom. inval.)]
MSTIPTARQAASSAAGKEATAAAPVVHALSCINCRQRKVRCSKTYPCPHCVKGGLECIFPSRKKDRVPRRNKNHELLNRLAKLEAIVGQVGPNSSRSGVDAAAPSPPSGSVSASTAEAIDSIVVHPTITPAQQAFESELRNPQKRCPTAQPVSKDDPAAKYVSGEFWANLSSEVEGIKAALEQPSDSEEDGDGVHDETSPESMSQGYQSSPSYYVTSPAVFGNAQAAGAGEGMLHPTPEKMRRLCETYFRNVDPLIKILHRPTIEETFNGFIASPVDNPLSRTVEALFFAMYFAAVTSLQPDTCKALLGEDRGLLVVQYRQAVEYALARADYLNSTSLETLQAFTLYSTCLRNHAESRASWAMLALVLRLSQAIGIHRDSDGLAFSPYEAEMRRRLWSQIIVLDVRAAQDRGTEPMVRQEEYNTIPPTNLNDSDFGPQTTVPLSQLAREGTTDVTFSLCTYSCSNLFLYIHGPRLRFSKANHETAPPTATTIPTNTSPRSLVQPQISEEDLVQRIKHLESQFSTPPTHSPSHHFQFALATSVIRIASLIYWLSIQYPWHVRQPTIKPRVSREHMLQTAVAIMELQAFGPISAGLDPAEFRERFMWWQDGYVQWHPLAVALAELCVQTEGPLVDRAWSSVERVWTRCGDRVADSRKGALWRPIKKLLRKARERRAEAQMRRLGISEEGQGVNAAQQGSEPAQTEQQPMIDLTVNLPPPQTQTPLNDTTAKSTTTQDTAKSLPPNPATEAGPTGIPLGQDLGYVPNIGGAQMVTNVDPLSTTPTTTAPAFILANDHNTRFAAIDFGDLNSTPMDALSAGGTRDVDTMDWSYWNEFVNDASVVFDTNHTSPSSEET